MFRHQTFPLLLSIVEPHVYKSCSIYQTDRAEGMVVVTGEFLFYVFTHIQLSYSYSENETVMH